MSRLKKLKGEKGQVGKKFPALLSEVGYFNSLLEKNQAIKLEVNRVGESVCQRLGLTPGSILELTPDGFWVVKTDGPPPGQQAPLPQPAQKGSDEKSK